MSQTLNITTIGNSVGIIMPRELLERMRVEKGDLLYVVETPGGIELTPYNPKFTAQMDIAEQVMHDHRDVLQKLAK